MPFPRPRWSIRRLMALVAIVAGLLGLKELADRRDRFRRRAATSAATAEHLNSIAVMFRRQLREEQRSSEIPGIRGNIDYYEGLESRYREREAFWRGMATRPWRSVPTLETLPHVNVPL